MPVRIQRKRTKGWKMPEGAVYVGRPTKWGNPFLMNDPGFVWTAVALGYMGDEDGRRAAAVELFRCWLIGGVPLLNQNSDSLEGALTFGDGRTVGVHEHISGFAAGVSALMWSPSMPPQPALDQLRGKDLACFCPLDRACHADVLLELSNQ